MRCPVCKSPIPDAVIVSASAAIIGAKGGAAGKGQVRNPKGRPPGIKESKPRRKKAIQ